VCARAAYLCEQVCLFELTTQGAVNRKAMAAQEKKLFPIVTISARPIERVWPRSGRSKDQWDRDKQERQRRRRAVAAVSVHGNTVLPLTLWSLVTAPCVCARPRSPLARLLVSAVRYGPPPDTCQPTKGCAPISWHLCGHSLRIHA
jgi:hypothetical protein